MPTFTSADGTTLAYHVTGTGEPLVVLPGGPMRASAYLGDLGGLGAHRTLYRLDLRGTGDSGTPADPASYRCDRQVADVEALRERLGLDQIDLLAHSAGGDLATLYAASHPERVSRLVLITPALYSLGVEFTGEQRQEAVALRADEPWYADAAAGFANILAGSPTDEDWRAVVPFTYGRWDAAAQAHAGAGAGQRNLAAAELYYAVEAADPPGVRAALSALGAPVLVLAGELDTGPRPATAREGAALFPKGESAVQPGAAHYPWLDDADAFTRLVAGFLR
ncbi:alpha/beta hydrolase [Micromonospora sp. NBC_01699]|uniref:alpha/beta fold hydrolase n=1 Tax=Micromonospora sp. NBC_01699 TaxID=2975984 RepID=UPI002E340AC2|nr:alpha/beta hydrolase [Micromonospora sp. NBC_01699]